MRVGGDDGELHGTTFTYTASSEDLMETHTSAIVAKETTDSRRVQGAGCRVQGLWVWAGTGLGCQAIPLLTQRVEV